MLCAMFLSWLSFFGRESVECVFSCKSCGPNVYRYDSISYSLFAEFLYLDIYIFRSPLVLYSYLRVLLPIPVAFWLLGSWVRIPLEAWMFVFVFLYCVVLCR
jgi:hypothetical protein